MKSSPFTCVIMLVVGFWLAGTILPACNKSNQSGISTPDSTITTKLNASPSSTYFYYAMTRTGLDSVLNDIDHLFTVFVPTDKAFENSGISIAYLQALSNTDLKNLVLYLIYAARTIQPPDIISSSDVKGKDQIETEANYQLVYLTHNANGFFINGIPIAKPDIAAHNGIIHFISSSVPLPPKSNLLQLIQSDTTLTFFSAALNRANPFSGTYDLISVASGGACRCPYTVFAPTNQAFQANGYPDTAAINAADPDSLEVLMEYHFLGGIMFTSDITNGLGALTLNQHLNFAGSDSLQFSMSGASVQVLGNHNAVPANVLKANIMATNGVLFTIDQVLNP